MTPTTILTPKEAWQRLESRLAPLPGETVPRAAARGRVLTEDLHATVDVPACDVSAMDGYALTGPVSPATPRRVVGTVAAGDPPGLTLEGEGAVRIMTGAPVPTGADRVIPVELTDGGREEVVLRAAVDAGAHIRRQGEILRRGETILPRGAVLTPGALSLVATHGHSSLPVVRPPRVAVMSTGDEVVPADAVPGPGQLRDSHTDFLLSACATLGVEAHSLGIAPDRPEVLRAKTKQGLDADVFLLCGGVSMGELDLVEGVLDELGCKLLFDAVAIQPGKPLVAAAHRKGVVFGLPGNPASAMVTFWLYVRPALRRLMGLGDAFWRGALKGRLEEELPPAKSRDRFLPAEVRFDDGEILVTPVEPKGSHDVAAYARGTALVRVPAESEGSTPGETCEILPLVDWSIPDRDGRGSD